MTLMLQNRPLLNLVLLPSDVDITNSMSIVAGLPYTVNYHTVTVGPESRLVVLIHARGRQG